MVVKDIFSFFKENDYSEAVVIKYTLDDDVKEFLLVSDFINWDLEKGKREFRKLLFQGVHNFKRIFGAYREHKKFDQQYQASNFTGTLTIEDINISSSDTTLNKVEIWLGHSFGGMEFEFVSLRSDSRIGFGKRIGKEDWIYVDVNKGQEFDFYNPF
ncbi:MAG: hypothetical protein HC880_05910 [Bacteroidia bacterium]|nr:hypothetical protein [Bacteroidia bacterium]